MPFPQAVLISLLLFLLDTVLFAALDYSFKGSVIRYGFPKRKTKSIKKLTDNSSFFARLFLTDLACAADKKGLYIILQLILNVVTVLVYLSVCAGFIGNNIFSGIGGGLFLLLIPMVTTVLLTTAITFIPDLICIPSERRRYDL